MQFAGPCKAPITIQLNGKLLGSTNLGAYKENWIEFFHVTGLTITGTGTFDGQGVSAWPSNKCRSGGPCKTLPMVNFNVNSSQIYFNLKKMNCSAINYNIHLIKRRVQINISIFCASIMS